MHTLKIITAGLVLLALFLFAGRYLGGSSRTLAKAAFWFIPVWLICAGVNMYVGVSRAGYSVAEEAPILAVVFGGPALVALLVGWRASRA